MKRFVGSTIGRKVLVAITGGALVLFLVAHLSGNIPLLTEGGKDALNSYAKWLHGLPIFPIIEVGLLLVFLVHIYLTVSLTLENRAKRAGSYKVRGTKASGMASVLASRTMAVSGLIVLVFLAVHVWDFRWSYGPKELADVHGSVREDLLEWWRMGLYTVGSLLVGWHMFHGIQSLPRTLGYHNPKLTPLIEGASRGLGLLIGLGFAAIPVWIALTH